MKRMTTKEKVVWTLTRYPEARVDYGKLYAYYIRYTLGIKLSDKDFNKLKSISPTTIFRTRTKLKNEDMIYPKGVEKPPEGQSSLKTWRDENV